MSHDAATLLHGVFPPIPTPFDDSGAVALDALAANLHRWDDYELAGYVVLGSNGEAAYLSDDECEGILETARRAIPQDKVLIAGTGRESTRATIESTLSASRAGADAALVVTPNYFDGMMTGEALVDHFSAVAAASSIPIVLYNVPKFTHVDMTAQTIAQLSQTPNVIGIKDSGGDIAKLGDTIRLARSGFQVMVGTAGVFFAGLALGATGGVLALANVAPQQAIDIYRLHAAGRWTDASRLQRRMLPVNSAITARFGIAGLKAALDMLGYYGGPVRAPLQALSRAETTVMRDVLREGGLLSSAARPSEPTGVSR